MSDSITTDAETQSAWWWSLYPITEASAGYGLQQLYLDWFLFLHAQKHMMKVDFSTAACVISS